MLFNKEQWLGVVRHLLTASGPVLAYVGIEVDEQTWMAVVGALMTIFGFAWSIAAPEKVS